MLLQSRGFVLKLVCHSVPCGIWNNSDNMFALELEKSIVSVTSRAGPMQIILEF